MKEKEIDNHQLAKRYFEGRITPSEEEIVSPMGGRMDAFL